MIEEGQKENERKKERRKNEGITENVDPSVFVVFVVCTAGRAEESSPVTMAPDFQ